MFNEILAGEGIPQEWNSAYKCSIHKKGNKNNCNNYRGVSIINSTVRLFSEVIKDKIENMIKTKISEEQAGFKTRKFSLDNIFCLQQIISKQHKRIKKLISFLWIWKRHMTWYQGNYSGLQSEEWKFHRKLL
jgi:hypothetical protein